MKFLIACKGSIRPALRILKGQQTTTTNNPFPIAQFGLVLLVSNMEKAVKGGKKKKITQQTLLDSSQEPLTSMATGQGIR